MPLAENLTIWVITVRDAGEEGRKTQEIVISNRRETNKNERGERRTFLRAEFCVLRKRLRVWKIEEKKAEKRLFGWLKKGQNSLFGVARLTILGREIDCFGM